MRSLFLRRALMRALLGLCGVVALAAITLAMPARADKVESNLRGQIEALVARHGFAVVGLNRLAAAPAKSLTGDGLTRNLRAILGDYNYLLIHDRNGGIRQLRILGAKLPIQPRYTIRTTRRGAHHLVETVLVGPNGTRQTFSLILDTGASTIVLPSSMIEGFGFDPGELTSGMANTANGPVPIRLGKLQQVRIGHVKAREVAIGFITDDNKHSLYPTVTIRRKRNAALERHSTNGWCLQIGYKRVRNRYSPTNNRRSLTFSLFQALQHHIAGE